MLSSQSRSFLNHFIPLAYLLSLAGGGVSGDGVMGWATFAWLMLFLFFRERALVRAVRAG